MSVQIVCGHCGGRNELGRVFCVHCGQRMDLSHASLQQLRRQRVASGGRRGIGQILVILALLAVAAVAGLALWPAPMPDASHSEGDRQRFRAKAEAMRAEFRARGTTQMAFTGAEVNAYLHGQRDRIGFDRIQAQLNDEMVTLRVARTYRPLARVKQVGAVPLRITSELRTGFDEGRWLVKGGMIGHLPLPGVLGWLVTPMFRRLPSVVLGDPQLAEALRQITVTPDRLVLALKK